MASRLIQSKGTLTFLRVHDVGTRFGPPDDSIDAEAVVKLSSHPDRAMGFQLRNDSNGLVHEAMLDLLRDAFVANLTVALDYSIDLEAGKKHGMILRVTLLR